MKTGVTGRLIYVPDAQGDRVMDFSMAGYGGGKQAIPSDVPVVIHIDPIVGDNTQHIQNAINFAASRPLQANGYRGVVELGPGKFDVSGHLNITTSGVVLRGAGGGDSLATNTHIVSQNRTDTFDSASTPVINISGSTSGSTQGSEISIIDKVVPVGAQSFRVASTAGLAVGSKIDVFRPSSAAWIAELGMDQMPEGAWTSRNLHYYRTITRIEGNRVFIDAPVTTAIDQQWSTGTIRTFTMPGVIRNVGVENLRGQSLDARGDERTSHADVCAVHASGRRVCARRGDAAFSVCFGVHLRDEGDAAYNGRQRDEPAAVGRSDGRAAVYVRPRCADVAGAELVRGGGAA